MASSFYDVSSRRRSSWFGPTANQRVLGPTDVSPVRWRHPVEVTPHREDNETENTNASPTTAATTLEPSCLRGRSRTTAAGLLLPSTMAKSQPQSQLAIDDATRAFSSTMKQPAALPDGWRPVSEAYDDVVTHRLWALDDGSNAMALSGGRQTSLSSPATTAAGLGGGAASSTLAEDPQEGSSNTRDRSIMATSHAAPRPSADRSACSDGAAAAGMPRLPATGGAPQLPPAASASPSLALRPMSGDPLLRTYQLRALAAQASGTASAWQRIAVNRMNADATTTRREGSPPGNKTLRGMRPDAAVSLLPARASSALLSGPSSRLHNTGTDAAAAPSDNTHLPPAVLPGPTLTRNRGPLGAAQSRISSAAARIAAVASELGSSSVQSFAALQRVLREKQQQDEAAAIAAATAAEIDLQQQEAELNGRQRRAATAVVAGFRNAIAHRHDEATMQRSMLFDASVALQPPAAESSTSMVVSLRLPPGGSESAFTSTWGKQHHREGSMRHRASAPIVSTSRTATTPQDHPEEPYAFASHFAVDDDVGGVDHTIVPTDAFPFAHLLSEEDVQLLGELAGTDGVMGEAGPLTQDMWAFEYDAIRHAAKAGLVNVEPASLMMAAAPAAGDGAAAPRASLLRRSSDSRPPVSGNPTMASNGGASLAAGGPSRTSVTMLGDGGPLLSGSAKATATNQGELGVVRRISRASVDRGTGRADDRPSAILERKLRALERRQTVDVMPMISLESFDVRSSNFEVRVRQVHSGATSEASSHRGSVVLSDDEGTPLGSDNGGGAAKQQQVLYSGGSTPATQGISSPVASVSPTSAVAPATTTATTTTLERRIRLQQANSGGSNAQEQSHTGQQTTTAATPRTKSIVDFFGKHAKQVVPEGETYIPSNELHLYQLYCLNTNMVLIFRPVSPSVPPMYAGNFFVPSQYCDADGIPLMIHEINPNLTLKDVLDFTVAECRVKGKGIGVSLKSSPYPPIDGFIPVNPSLSKTYSEARRKERALEDNLINAAGGGEAMSTALLRKMRSQRSLFSAATSVAMKEIEASLKDSDQRLKKLLDAYGQQSSYAIDKLGVAEEFIGILNESQFLGKTVATWRGLPIYYKQAQGEADVERRENAHPVFYCLRGDELVVYDMHRNELDNHTAVPLGGQHGASSSSPIGTLYHPVYILTHRSFVISPISKRIEQDPQGDFLIGPDFDGFAYAAHIQTADRATPAQYMSFVEQQMNLRVLPTMGLVNDLDVEHILEMRRLTEWKQSHGYECSNTLKTQDISDGPHVIIMPNEVRIATNFPELMAFYREAWQCGYPLLLNPNWRVVISPVDHLPLTIGDELSLPIVDDCGLAMLKHHLASVGRKFEDVKEEATQYIDELVGMRRQGVARLRVAGMYSTSLVPRVAIVVARKKLAETFYTLRRWMLMPPLFESDRLNTFDDDLSPSASSATPSGRAALARRASTVFTAGKGGKKQVVPVSLEFERYRDEKVSALLAGFDEECALFDALFGADDPRFVRRLKQFTDPSVIAQAAMSASLLASEDSQRANGGLQDNVSYLAPSTNDPAKSSEKGAGLSAVAAANRAGAKQQQFVPSVDASGERPFA